MVIYKRFILIINCLFISYINGSAQNITGHVIDAMTRTTISFVTLKMNAGKQGIIADLNGKFTIAQQDLKENPTVQASCIGYQDTVFSLDSANQTFCMVPTGKMINEFTFQPDDQKVARILKLVSANKNRNDPDKLPWYQCKMYYKMVADVQRTDTPKANMTKEEQKFRDFTTNQHLMMSETYSRRTWSTPQQLQEDVIASRFSGFSKSLFTALVTDVLPFHAYDDYLVINGKDYRNPIGKGATNAYFFNLSDELVANNDTTWVITFRPKQSDQYQLRGRLYINSNGYAISNLVASATDTLLQFRTKLEQQYERKTGGQWFPSQLNYVINWRQNLNGKSLVIDMVGSTNVDSVSFEKDDLFSFDKAHTIRQTDDVAKATELNWEKLRARPLDDKEKRTYQILDSIGAKAHLDDKMNIVSKSPDYKITLGLFDYDLRQLFDYNQAEGVRLGLGIQTGDKISTKFSVGGYGAWGFADKTPKYGGFFDWYMDKYKDHSLRCSFTDDISDPGRLKLSPDLDKNYLNSYLITREDRVRSLSLNYQQKTGYTHLNVNLKRDYVQPQYSYFFINNGIYQHCYNVGELSLGLRYVFAERTVPFFNSYYSNGSKYPAFYFKINAGEVDSGKILIRYVQCAGAVKWNKHVNRMGMEHVLISCAVSKSDAPLPLGKLFAGNGYNYVSGSYDPSVYTFGGLMTITPYQFYMDRFVSFIYRHDFDRRFFVLEHRSSTISSAPYLCLQYDLLVGGMANPENQQGISFSVPNKPFSEAGVLLKNLVRLRYANLYYLTIDGGYFTSLYAVDHTSSSGRFVIGAGIDI